MSNTLLTQRIVKEGGRTPPPYPSIFIKPSTSIASFNEDIPIPKLAQDTVDYEGELVRANIQLIYIKAEASYSPIVSL